MSISVLCKHSCIGPLAESRYWQAVIGPTYRSQYISTNKKSVMDQQMDINVILQVAMNSAIKMI
jgi:hypothetical protein